ncbi:MAG: cyanophycinase [Candidatus Obscuribacterales bacterium]|nr:cyanophycinase [Candidatus Obscuribacterales bacterium]
MGIFTRFLVGRRAFSLGLGALFCNAAVEAKESSEKSEDKFAFKGTLYPIGGAADSTLRRFSELAGAGNAKIVILPHSSSTPQETADDLANSFMALGVKNTVTILPGDKSPIPSDSTAIFMSGGDQSRLMRLIEKAQADQIRAFLLQGGLVGGTSAGAALVAPRMIAGGMSDGLPKSMSLMITDGLALLPGYMVDTHVGARGRHDRLMVGLSMLAGVKGIGLDEDTAVEIKNGRATVRGAGVAHVYRRSDSFKSDLPSTPEGEMAGVQGMIYSIYPAGESFEI